MESLTKFLKIMRGIRLKREIAVALFSYLTSCICSVFTCLYILQNKKVPAVLFALGAELSTITGTIILLYLVLIISDDSIFWNTPHRKIV